MRRGDLRWARTGMSAGCTRGAWARQMLREASRSTRPAVQGRVLEAHLDELVDDGLHFGIIVLCVNVRQSIDLSPRRGKRQWGARGLALHGAARPGVRGAYHSCFLRLLASGTR